MQLIREKNANYIEIYVNNIYTLNHSLTAFHTCSLFHCQLNIDTHSIVERNAEFVNKFKAKKRETTIVTEKLAAYKSFINLMRKMRIIHNCVDFTLSSQKPIHTALLI